MAVTVSVTIKIEGPEDEVRDRIRPFWEGTEPPSVGPSSTDGAEPEDDRLGLFVGGLTPVGWEIVETIARASAENRPVSRRIIVSQVGFPLQQFSGALGGIATLWASTVGGRSPFVGRKNRSLGDIAYRIDSELAIRIVAIMDNK